MLIDCHFLCWRAFHTTGNLSYEDIPTGVVYGFLATLESIYEKWQPCEFVFAWDSSKSYRKKQFPEYKQRNDDLTEEEIEELVLVKEQMKDLRTRILPEIGLHNNLLLTGLEADDIIAEFAFANKESTLKMVVVSGDEDLYQLLECLDFFQPVKNETFTEAKFKHKYGIEPGQWGEVKAMAGCSSDNVPGLKGVGEKTAIRYLTGELGQHTKAYTSIAENSDYLAEMRRLVILPHEKTPELPGLALNKFNSKGFDRICEEYGLRKVKQKKDLWKEML